MIGRNVRAGRRGQRRKRSEVVALPVTPDAGDGEKRLAIQREAMLGLWVFLPGELEEAARGDQAPVAVGEAEAPLRGSSPWGGHP